MCDRACREWMITNGYWKRWIKPELGLNSLIEVVCENGETKVSRNYTNRPVGDQPELLPHDSSLNHDMD
jgi:hypothetical protein